MSSGAQKRAPPVDGIILPGNVRAYVPTSTVWEETESTSVQNTTAQESVVHYILEGAQSTMFDDSLLLCRARSYRHTIRMNPCVQSTQIALLLPLRETQLVLMVWVGFEWNGL